MRKNYLLLIIISMFLIGCSSDVAKLPSFNSNPQLNGNQALIVVKLDNFDYLDLIRVENDQNNPKLSKKYRILKPNRMFVYNYVQSLFTIEPGTYYISFLAIDSDKGVYYSDAPGLDPKGRVEYGAFTVQPGEVLYLGDVDCQWKSTNKVKKLTLQDQISEVKKDLDSAGHPDLAAKIVNAKFIPRGANLDISEQAKP